MECNNIKPITQIPCPSWTEQQVFEHKRWMMRRSAWIANVMRVLKYEKWEAESAWVRIEVANHNDMITRNEQSAF